VQNHRKSVSIAAQLEYSGRRQQCHVVAISESHAVIAGDYLQHIPGTFILRFAPSVRRRCWLQRRHVGSMTVHYRRLDRHEDDYSALRFSAIGAACAPRFQDECA
jgi:hypothetical protein